jgi:hypothetical protein
MRHIHELQQRKGERLLAGNTLLFIQSFPDQALLFHRWNSRLMKVSQGSPEGIIAARMKGMAFKDPFCCEEPSFNDPVFLYGKGGIGGACGHKPTRGWEKGRYCYLIKPY